MTEPTSEQLNKGFTCRTKGCFRQHVFGPYVYAHWDFPLHHTCGNCGALSVVHKGRVTLSKPGKIRKLDPSKLNGHAHTMSGPTDQELAAAAAVGAMGRRRPT